MKPTNPIYVGSPPLEPPDDPEHRCKHCTKRFETERQYIEHLKDCDGVD